MKDGNSGEMNSKEAVMSVEENLKQYPPGSSKACLKGCLCPVLDNEYGRGYMGIVDFYVITEGCPLHDGSHRNQHLSLESDPGDESSNTGVLT